MTDKEYYRCIGVIVVSAASLIYQGFIVSTLWNIYIAPSLILPRINPETGIALIVMALIAFSRRVDFYGFFESWRIGLIHAILKPSACLLIGLAGRHLF